MARDIIEEFQKKYPTKEDKIEALKKMTNEQIDELINASSNIYGKIFYSKYKKKEINNEGGVVMGENLPTYEEEESKVKIEDVKEGTKIDIQPEPMTEDYFDEVVVKAINEIEEHILEWITIGYESTRSDDISCIQTCLDETEEKFCVEIVIDNHDDRPFHIYAKDGLEKSEALTIFYDTCVKFENLNIDGWDDVTDDVNYIDDDFEICYYAARDENGKVLTLAKIDDCIAYAWIDGAWVERPNLIKIQFDVTADYDEISESEANRLIERGEV